MATTPGILALPKTEGCLVCGPTNPHGLNLRFYVDPASGLIATEFTPGPQHIGFEGVLHGGVLAMVLDEAMVWAAIWSARRACLAAELNVRYRQPAAVGERLRIETRVTAARSRLIQTEGRLLRNDRVVAESTGKYVPRPEADSRAVLTTFLVDDESREACRALGHPSVQ